MEAPPSSSVEGPSPILGSSPQIQRAPVAKPVAKPMAKPVAKPIAKAPVAKFVAAPVPGKLPSSPMKVSAKPMVKPSAKPVAKLPVPVSPKLAPTRLPTGLPPPPVKPAPKPVAKPVAKEPVRPPEPEQVLLLETETTLMTLNAVRGSLANVEPINPNAIFQQLVPAQVQPAPSVVPKSPVVPKTGLPKGLIPKIPVSPRAAQPKLAPLPVKPVAAPAKPKLPPVKPSAPLRPPGPIISVITTEEEEKEEEKEEEEGDFEGGRAEAELEPLSPTSSPVQSPVVSLRGAVPPSGKGKLPPPPGKLVPKGMKPMAKAAPKALPMRLEPIRGTIPVGATSELPLSYQMATAPSRLHRPTLRREEEEEEEEEEGEMEPTEIEPIITEENIEEFEPLRLPTAISSTRVKSPPRELIAETTGKTATATTDIERAMEYLSRNPNIIKEVNDPKVKVERLKEIARGLHIKGISVTKEVLRGKILSFLGEIQHE